MIRVVIADDHEQIRAVLRLLLSYFNEVQVVGEAVNGWEAVECVKRLIPDIVLMDVSMPVMDGLAAARQIAEMQVATRVILISLHTGEHMVRRAVDAGAQGFILKDRLGTSLRTGIQAVHRGEIFFLP